MKANRQRLLTTISMVVDCWDRAKTHKDFAEQVGAHIEDLRDILHSERSARQLKADVYFTWTSAEGAREWGTWEAQRDHWLTICDDPRARYWTESTAHTKRRTATVQEESRTEAAARLYNIGKQLQKGAGL